MDGERFDNLARLLSRGHSRRAALRSLIGGAVVGTAAVGRAGQGAALAQTRPLILTYIVDCDPTTNTWRVRNTTDEAIAYTWDDANSDLAGDGVAPPSSDTFFQTPDGTQTIRLFVDGQQVDVKASGGDNTCAEDQICCTSADGPASCQECCADSDCEDGETCNDGVCEPATGCQSDDDCPGRGQVCCGPDTDKPGRCVGHGRDGGNRACYRGKSGGKGHGKGKGRGRRRRARAQRR